MPGRSKTRTRTRKWNAIDLISRPSDNGFDVEDVEEDEGWTPLHYYIAVVWAILAVVVAGILIIGGVEAYAVLTHTSFMIGPAITVCPVPTGKP
jgi:hypothetical protein